MVPEKIPSIYNGEKTVIYGLLMEKSEQKGESMKCKATLTGDIIRKKFKFDIPFELTEGGPEEADVSVIHQLAVKGMIQEWQDDEDPYEQKHKKEIIELSTDASVVSKYTAYIAVDVAQNKPVSGSMQSYQLTATNTFKFSNCKNLFSGLPTPSRSMGYFGGAPPPPGGPPHPYSAYSMSLSCSAANFGPQPLLGGGPPPSMGDVSVKKSKLMKSRGHPKPAMLTSVSAPSPAKEAGASFIASLQQANGSWLLNDQLVGVVSKSVEELKSCCPVSCDDIMMSNIWATLVVIELLKKKYPSMLDELELVIMKAEHWLSKQVLPSGINLTTLKEHADKFL